jgi:hypothetical protein
MTTHSGLMSNREWVTASNTSKIFKMKKIIIDYISSPVNKVKNLSRRSIIM